MIINLKQRKKEVITHLWSSLLFVTWFVWSPRLPLPIARESAQRLRDPPAASSETGIGVRVGVRGDCGGVVRSGLNKNSISLADRGSPVVFTAATVELCGGSLVGLSRCRIVDLGLWVVGALVLISWSSSGAVICWVSFPNQSFFFLLVYVYKFKIISRMKMNLNFSFCFWLLYNGVWRPFFVCLCQVLFFESKFFKIRIIRNYIMNM